MLINSCETFDALFSVEMFLRRPYQQSIQTAAIAIVSSGP